MIGLLIMLFVSRRTDWCFIICWCLLIVILGCCVYAVVMWVGSFGRCFVCFWWILILFCCLW